jgi:carbon monoxide dehydrogenase subunit G
MEMTGEFRIPAPRQRVWEGLNDPEILKSSIPGCQTIEKLSDTEFTAKVLAQVGPVKANFAGKVTLADLTRRRATRSPAKARAASPALRKAAPR